MRRGRRKDAKKSEERRGEVRGENDSFTRRLIRAVKMCTWIAEGERSTLASVRHQRHADAQLRDRFRFVLFRPRRGVERVGVRSILPCELVLHLAQHFRLSLEERSVPCLCEALGPNRLRERTAQRRVYRSEVNLHGLVGEANAGNGLLPRRLRDSPGLRRVLHPLAAAVGTAAAKLALEEMLHLSHRNDELFELSRSFPRCVRRGA